MKKLFGTDGIRGKANAFPMDIRTVQVIGMATGYYFLKGEHRHKVVIGKDTRLSGYMIEQALTSGFLAMGMDVVLVGPMPTPAISMITKAFRADLGVMISASHNPYYDNGIKFFDSKGFKLSDSLQNEIEELFEKELISGFLSTKVANQDKIGRAKRLEDASGRYIEFAKNTFPKNLSLEGLKIAIDCANGAAYKIAPTVLWELGAQIIEVGVEPNGFNINKECGSTNVNQLSKVVLENSCDIGIALDGDADRLIMVDEKGGVIDGDQILATIALYWKKQGLLKNKNVVATVMSNMALDELLAENDITLHKVNVGDRYVLEKIKQTRANLGGEQSGHIIFSDYSATGDGLVAALQVLAVLVKQEDKASKVLMPLKPFPQILKNLKYKGSLDLQDSKIKNALDAFEERLKEQGRILIRKSGTEALIRIMVEGKDINKITEIAGEIEQFLNNEIKKTSA